MFCQEVRLYIQGDSRAASLVQENRQTYAAYKCDIRSTAPQFLPFPSASESDTNPTEYLDLEDDPYDDEDSSFLGPPSIELHGHMYLEDLKSHIEKSVTLFTSSRLFLIPYLQVIDARASW